MTKEEVLLRLKYCEINNIDAEGAHKDADNVLCDFLVSLGFQDVVDAYNEIERWYA